MFEHKTVLVTGANGALGLKLIQAFSESGAVVFAHARRYDEKFCEYLERLSEKYETRIQPVFFDLRDTADIARVIREFSKDEIFIDILINNAGVEHGGLFQMTPVSTIKDVFDVNFFAQLELTQRILRLMIKRRAGAIVNVSSIAAIHLDVGNIAYGTSKAALISATKTIASEVGKLGVRVNAVAPGLIANTRMAGQMESKAEKKMISDSAMQRKAQIDEVVNVIIFLSSNKSSFVNGQVICVDGGSA